MITSRRHHHGSRASSASADAGGAGVTPYTDRSVASDGGGTWILPDVGLGTLHDLAAVTDVPPVGGGVELRMDGNLTVSSLVADVNAGSTAGLSTGTMHESTAAGFMEVDASANCSNHPTVSGSLLFDGDDGLTRVRFLLQPYTV